VAPFLELLRQRRLRLDQHAAPAAPFQVPGLRNVLGVVGADLDEISRPLAEERLLELSLGGIGEDHALPCRH